jgi:IS4 transposase
MSTKPKVTVEAALERLLAKRQREVVDELKARDWPNRMTAIQSVRYLLDLGITAHAMKLENDRVRYLKGEAEFFVDYAIKHVRDVVNGERPDV